jgi:hypothetical protein
MTRREISLYIDIQMADSEPVGDTAPHHLRQSVKYVALNGAGSILATKTYAQATQQNSINFINYVLGRTSTPIRIIRTDWSLVFEREFARHLSIFNLRHERVAPYAANDLRF